MITNPLLLEIPEQTDTTRLTLRPLVAADAPFIWREIEESRESLERWMPWAQYHISPTDTKEFIERQRSQWFLREGITYGIHLKPDDFLIGTISFQDIDWTIPSMQIGYWMGIRHRKMGYTVEAVAAMQKIAFENLSIERLELRCDENNIASQRIADNAGFTLEGVLKHHKRDHQYQLVNIITYAILKSEYEEQKHG